MIWLWMWWIMYNDNAFVYWEDNSKIHSLSPIFKIISVIIMFFCIMFSNSLVDIFVCFLYVFVVIIYSDISIRAILSSLNLFKYILFLLFFVISLIYLNVLIGFFIVFQICLFIIYLSVISMSTSFYQMLTGVRSLFSWLESFECYNKVCLNTTLYIKFLSILYIEDDRIRRSRKLRGVRFNEMGLVDRIDDFFGKLTYLFRVSFERISRIKYSMYQKKYGVGKGTDNYVLNNWNKTDTIMIVINVMVMIIVAVY